MRTFFCLLIGLLAMTAMGQNRISGRITNERGEHLAHVMVKAYMLQKSVPAAYTKTNAAGEYVLPVGEQLGNEIVIKYSLMGYHTHTERIRNRSFRLDISLQTDPKGLREVTVRAPTVRTHGDTIRYSVSNLRGPTDRNIEDVIRRIPGVTVESGGQIKYNGEAINRFYIEGLDMLNGRYTLATRNIRPDDVAGIDVYERHQPVRLLNGVEPDKHAALNLRLKNSGLNHPVGNLLAGLGIRNGITAKGELFALSAHARRQHLAAAKGNNFSENYHTENESQYADNPANERTPAADLLPPMPFGTPAVPADRYLNNRSAMVSVNNLLKLREGLTLTANADYCFARNDYTMQAGTTYSTGEEQPITVTDDNETLLHKHQGQLALKWERNDSTHYVLNNLHLRTDRTLGDYTLGHYTVAQHNDQHTFGITNQLDYMGRKGNRITRFYSRVALHQVPESHLAARIFGSEADFLLQRIEGLSLRTYHATHTDFVLGQNGKSGTLSLLMNLKADYHRIDLRCQNAQPDDTHAQPVAHAPTALQTQLPAPTLSRTDGYDLSIGLTPLYKRFIKPFYLELALPVKFQSLRFTHRANGLTGRSHRPYAGASAQLDYLNFAGLRMELSGVYLHRLGSLRDMMCDPVFLTFREQMQPGNGRLSHADEWRVTGTLIKNAPIHGRHFNLSGGYTRTRDNRLWESRVAADGQTSGQAASQNTVRTAWNALLSLSKTYYGRRLSLRLQSAVTAASTPLVRQTEKISARNRAYMLGASAEKHWFGERLSVALSATWQRLSNQLRGNFYVNARTDDYTALCHVAVYPLKRLEVYAHGRLAATGTPGARYDRNFYLDAGARLKFKTFDLELNARNLTNRRNYVLRTYTDADFTTYTYRLRPAECLLTAKWNF